MVAVDRLANRHRFAPDRVEELCARHPGRRGVTRIPGVLALTTPYSGSPMETRIRLLIVAAGLPCPEVQWVVQDVAARTAIWLDLAWPELMIGIEYEGGVHTEPGRVLRDIGRHTRLVDRDHAVVSIRAAGQVEGRAQRGRAPHVPDQHDLVGKQRVAVHDQAGAPSQATADDGDLGGNAQPRRAGRVEHRGGGVPGQHAVPLHQSVRGQRSQQQIRWAGARSAVDVGQQPLEPRAAQPVTRVISPAATACEPRNATGQPGTVMQRG